MLTDFLGAFTQFGLGVGGFAGVEDEERYAAVGQELAQPCPVYQFGVAVVGGVFKKEKAVRLVRITVNMRVGDFTTAHALRPFRCRVGAVTIEVDDVVRLAIGMGVA